MKRVMFWISVLCLPPMLGAFLLWYWLTPHKHPTLRRAEQGDVQAMYLMGEANLTVKGDGIVKDPNNAAAIFWLRKASAKGHIGAMWTISDLGIPNEEKVMWLKKGAELGSGACVTELIKGYRHGLYGLEVDPVEAFHWVKLGWEMDFKERRYSPQQQVKELDRLLSTYRANLEVVLHQKGKRSDEIASILAQIR